MTEPLLVIENFRLTLPLGAERRYALDNVSLTVGQGEIVCLVGESGSGKSLTAGAITRLLPSKDIRVESGRILFEGRDIMGLSEKEMIALRGAGIAMIFQDPMTALNPQKTIGWQLEEVFRLHTNLGRAERRTRALRMLAKVNITDPERVYRAYPHQISGGQRQRAMISMALALDPRLIIADEPTTALDVTTQIQILDLIKGLHHELKPGVLFITHDFGVVAEVADRVAVLCQGELVEQGSVAQVLGRPQHAYTKALLSAVPSLVPPPPRAVAIEPVLSARSLSKIFRPRLGLLRRPGESVPAVVDASFHLRRGEVLGIVGESGSGKSTMARIITRLVEADSGEALIECEDILSASTKRLRQLRADIQMVFQDPMASLNPRKRAIDIIAQGPLVQGVSRSDAYNRAFELLKLVGLNETSANRFPHEFSGGQRQRIGIARALAVRPKILVADEPVSALDVSVQAQVLELLSKLRDKMALSIIFVTHDLRVAAQLCDRIMVMSSGKVVETGLTAEVFRNPKHPYTNTLLSSIPGRAWGHFAAASEAHPKTIQHFDNRKVLR